MLYRSNRPVRRPAAAMVETAAVIIIFVLVLFGVIEYCRFFFMRQLMINAAREGARYAVVHTNDATVDPDTRAQITNRMVAFDSKVQNFTIQLYHADSNGNRFTTYDSTVSTNYAYSTDSTGPYLLDNTGTKIYALKDSTGPYVLDNSNNKVYLNLNSPTGTVTGVNAGLFTSYVSSKQIQSVDPITNAMFGQYIAVEISCNYNPITPALLRMNQTITIHVKALMYSEAN
jgi:Flp pilus assembly protein TadG